MDTKKSEVLSLEEVFFKGVAGEVGPLSLGITAGEDKTAVLKDPQDCVLLTQIVKGMSAPLKGRVIKKGKDATGWVMPDGIVALMGQSFFSKTVKEEILFAAGVGETKRKIDIPPFLSGVLERSGFELWDERPISELSSFEKKMLVLVSALLMTPECLVWVNPLDGLTSSQIERYLTLLRYGKDIVRFATLQILSEGQLPFSFEDSPRGEIGGVGRWRT